MSDPARFSSKPPAPSGISSTEANKLRSSIAVLEKDVRELREKLDERNQWSTTIRGWLQKTIRVQVSTGELITGKLLWLDRYTICVDVADIGEVIIHKGQLVMLHQLR